MTEGGEQAFQLSEEKWKRTDLPNLALKWMKNHSYFITTLPIPPVFLLEEQMSEGAHEGVKLSDGQYDNVLILIREGVNEGVR